MQQREIDLWKAADAAFDALLDLPAAQRATALAAAGLEPAVRDRVRRLLDADSSAPASAPDAFGGDGFTGRRIGRWVLECEIGRGGMSVVFRAHAHDAPDRLAALKLITLGALAGPGLERFRREQAILARLRHPHIATLLDAGVEADGTPWLAMALVDGRPIDGWCEARRVDLRGRVRLLLDVCAAVAHAHRALVVHRDLKPSNILVDAEGHVRLLDFGIARLTDDTLGESTATHWRALSPSYAAPEQFGGAAPSTAMDVFGLGAVLYALLCGHPPRTGSGNDRGSDVEPASRAALRPSPLQYRPSAQALRGDLDAILHHALAVDPALRYPSAEAFAADLQRWLAGEPVLARGSGAVYRLRRFLRRHWATASMATVAAASLLGGTLVALDRAREAEAMAARAAAVQDFVLGIFRANQSDARGDFVVSKREVAEEAARRLAAAERAGEAFDPALSLALARVLADLGLDQQARARVEAARARLGPASRDDPLSIDAAVALARLALDRDRSQEAEALLREALAALRDAAPAQTLRARSLLAMALYYQVRIDEAVSMSDGVVRTIDAVPGIAPEQATDALLDHAVVLRAAGRLDEAIDAAARAASISEAAFGADNPRLVRVLDLLGTLQRRGGRVVAALASQQRALDLARSSAGSIGATRLANLARSLLALGDAARAQGLAVQALEKRREELGPDHPALAETEEVLVLARAALGDASPADAFYARWLAGDRGPTASVPDSRRHTTHGRLLLERGDLQAAQAAFARAATVEGDTFPARVARAAARLGLGCVAASRGDAPAAVAALDEATREVAAGALELEDRIALETCRADLDRDAARLDAALDRRTRLDAALAPLLGEASPRRARLMREQAALLASLGRDAEAQALRRRADAVAASSPP